MEFVSAAGRGVAETAIALLGYAESGGNLKLPERIRALALPLLNTVYADLSAVTGGSFTPLSSLDDEIVLPWRALYDAMPYGVAMLFAQSEGDTDSEAAFASLYNAKRACLSRREQQQNIIPRGDDL